TREAKELFARVLTAEPANPDARRWLMVAENSVRPGAAEPEKRTERRGEPAADPGPGDIPAAGRRPGSVSDTAGGPGPETVAAREGTDGAVVGAPAIAARRSGRPADGSVARETDPEPEETEDEPGPETMAPLGRNVSSTLQRMSGEVDALVRKGEVAFKASDLISAERYFRAALARNPGHARSQYHLGLIHKARRETDKALAALEKARQMNPRNVDILLELGQLYTEANLPNPAIQRLEELLTQDPNNLAGHYALGVNYEKARRYNRAEDEYRTIQKLYPDFIEAHDYLGNLYFTQRRFKQACGEYERLAEARPKDPRPRFKMAVALFYGNERNRARVEFTALRRQLAPGDALLPKVQGYLGKL
ncbi:MAG: tetratricopeptide repeat protein, partial [Candidatus Riflebacteria bacterium]|nr:tetratricopeptide repeat protein [Candidatus Riflebacteria bacterium]